MTTPRAETSQTLDRGLRILSLLAGSGTAGLSISELANALGVGRPVIYRLVATLVEHDLVRRSEEGGAVRLGMGLVSLARSVEPALREVATPILRRLANAAGATAHLTLADGAEATAVVVVEPNWTDYHVGYRVGSRHPIERGAAGRAILAGRTGDPSVVGSAGELQPGAQGVAAPVLGIPGLEASVGVVAVGELAVRVGEQVAAAARELAAALR